LSPSGTAWQERVIYNVPIDGAGLTIDAAGNIFGTSSWTAFELSPNGSGGWNPAVIYTFKAPNKESSNPEGTLVLDSAGNLYGTTAGVNGPGYTNGNVYELSPTEQGPWTFKNIFSFNAADGAQPQGGIVFDAAGNIYGTTTAGGPPNLGTVFELTGPDQKGVYKQKLQWNFKGPNGQDPIEGVILDSAGNLYGTAALGGPKNAGLVFQINPSPVITKLSSSPNPSTYGEAVTFTAVITSGAGAPPDGETVTFKHGTTVLGTGALSGGSASFTTSTLGAGTTSVTALYAGDSNFSGCTSNTVKQVVKKVTTATTLASSQNPSTYGQAVTFTAVITSGAGAPQDGETVTFKHGTTVLGTGSLSGGSASFTTSVLPVGTNSITAVYGGDIKFAASTSNTVKQVVN